MQFEFKNTVNCTSCYCSVKAQMRIRTCVIRRSVWLPDRPHRRTSYRRDGLSFLHLPSQGMCLAREKPSPKLSALRLPPNKINKECVAASSAGLQQSGVQAWGWPFKPHMSKHVLRRCKLVPRKWGAGIQTYGWSWIPHQVRNDNPKGMLDKALPAF